MFSHWVVSIKEITANEEPMNIIEKQGRKRVVESWKVVAKLMSSVTIMFGCSKSLKFVYEICTLIVY